MPSKTAITRFPVIVTAAVAAIAGFQSPARSADLVGGTYAPPAKYSREARVVRTTYRRGDLRDCQLLRVTDPDGSRVVEVCFRPVF